MKTLIVIALIMLLLAPCFATTPGVGVWLCNSPTVRVYMGTDVRSSDGKDFNDALYPTIVRDWATAFYHENGVDGWDGDTGFYGTDARSPLVVGQTKTWTLYVWYTYGYSYEDYVADFHWWEIPGHDPALHATLQLIQKPAGVTGGPEVGTLWTDPSYRVILPMYTPVGDPFTAYAFRFTMTMVPEPSSLLALSAGLVSAGAILGRRRRR